MKNYMMIVHRFSEPGYTIIDVKGKYKSLAKKCHGLTLIAPNSDIDKLLTMMYEADENGSRIDLMPEQHRGSVSQIMCNDLFGTVIDKLDGRDGEFTLSVFYWDVELPNVHVQIPVKEVSKGIVFRS